jgi:hypothetical protein
MSARQLADPSAAQQPAEQQPDDLFSPLLEGAAGHLGPYPAGTGVLVGELMGVRAQPPHALVTYPGHAGAAPAIARSVVDLHGSHIGKSVVLMFENGDPARPIVMGVLQGAPGWPAAERPQQVEIDADGQRMVIGAKQQLVLRCGAASITLEQDGKVSIRGTQIVSQADGANRIRGGSVQLN